MLSLDPKDLSLSQTVQISYATSDISSELRLLREENRILRDEISILRQELAQARAAQKWIQPVEIQSLPTFPQYPVYPPSPWYEVKTTENTFQCRCGRGNHLPHICIVC